MNSAQDMQAHEGNSYSSPDEKAKAEEILAPPSLEQADLLVRDYLSRVGADPSQLNSAYTDNDLTQALIFVYKEEQGAVG